MRHYTRPRPTLPDTTPFLADSKFADISPWHGESVRKVVPTTTNTTSSTSEFPVTVISTDDMMIHTARSSQTTATGVVSVISSLSSFFDPPKQRVQHRLKSKHKSIPPLLSTNSKYIPPIIAPSSSSASSSVASQLPSVSYMNNGNIGGLPMLSRIQPPNVLSLTSPGGTKLTSRMRLASLHSINESQAMSSASVLEAEMDDFVDIEIERKETQIGAMKDKVRMIKHILTRHSLSKPHSTSSHQHDYISLSTSLTFICDTNYGH